MNIEFIQAKPDHSVIIGNFVIDLTSEICRVTNANHFDIKPDETLSRCRELLVAGHYSAIIGYYKDCPVAVATFTEAFALYAGGKVGTIQEFYVIPEQRSEGIGGLLIEQVREYGALNDWSNIELCAPPLPEFDRTLDFYQRNGLSPVGGRKMRCNIDR